MKLNVKKNIIPAFIFLLSIVIAAALAVAVWNINFWPTDAEVFYFEPAVKLPHLKHLSQIHGLVDTERIRWLHGKEIYVLAVSWAQRLIGDIKTLRPFMLVGIVSICWASIFVYLTARRYWGPRAGLVCYLAFAGSMWPYIYILFAKHQTLGMCLFLLAVFFQRFFSVVWRYPVFFLSGGAMGLALFASTVSSLYVPFYAVAWVYEWKRACPEEKWSGLVRKGLPGALLTVLGGLTAFVYVNWPDIGYNLKSFLEYVDISGSFNHFYYNQFFLKQWFQNQNVAGVRGGWLWIWRYFFVIMPVLFPVYLATVAALVLHTFRKKSFAVAARTAGIIFLSTVPVLMAEAAKVAQYGANYFPFLIGVVLVIGYASSLIKPEVGTVNRWGIAGVAMIILLHIGVNGWAFVTDIYPTRMVTTLLSQKIRDLNVKRLYTYRHSPHRDHFLLNLNPEVYAGLELLPFDYLIQPRECCILLPPVTGDSIYIASMSRYSNYSADPFLVKLARDHRLEDYAVASFPTLANSRIWVHEEEILSYRRLILGDQFPDNKELGRVRLLDGEKIYKDLSKIAPDSDILYLFRTKHSNIGTKDKFFIYDGYTGKFTKDMELNHLIARIYKVGDPRDSLRAYVYKLDDQQTIWIPFGDNFISQPAPADIILSDNEDGVVLFKFDPPLFLKEGSYFFIIYRTGPPDDKNYYRIENDYIGSI